MKSAYCCLPEAVYTTIQTNKCQIILKGDTADIINEDTGELIITLYYSSEEERTEVVFVSGNSIEETMKVDQYMNFDGESIPKRPPRLKTQKIKPKEKLIQDPKEIEFIGPIETTNTISEFICLKEHIRGTIEYIENFQTETDKFSALIELATFIMKNKKIKQLPQLQILFENLKIFRKKKDFQEYRRTLHQIADRL